jgi:hypothetical protein
MVLAENFVPLFTKKCASLRIQFSSRQVRLRRALPVWVLGTLAKRWTAALQPEGFDSPALLGDRQAKKRNSNARLGLRYLDFNIFTR